MLSFRRRSFPGFAGAASVIHKVWTRSVPAVAFALLIGGGVDVGTAAGAAAVIERIGAYEHPDLKDHRSFVISPDEAHVYSVGPRAYPDPIQYRVQGMVYAWDGASGALEPLPGLIGGGAALDGANLFAIALSADGTHAYVTFSRLSKSGVAVFLRDAASGALSLIEVEEVAAESVFFQALAVSPDGGGVYAASYDALYAFERDSLTGELAFVEANAGDFQAAETVVVSPDGSSVYVSLKGCERSGGVAVYSRDSATSEVTYLETEIDQFPSSCYATGWTDVAISPDGAHVYVSALPRRGFTDIFDRKLIVYDRDPVTGSLTHVATESNGIGGRRIAVSPDGAHVYTHASSSEDGGVILQTASRDPSTGLLTLLEQEEMPMVFEDVVVAPGGGEVILGGDGLLVLARDAGTGELSRLSRRRKVVSPCGSVMGVNEGQLYVCGRGSILTLDREGATGAVSLVDEYFHELPDTRFRFEDIAVSPGGEHLYASGNLRWEFGYPGGNYDREEYLLTFDLDSQTGQPTLVRDELAGVVDIGIPRVFGIAISPDGKHAYVAGHEHVSGVGRSGGVAAFERNPVTGALSFIESELEVGDRDCNTSSNGVREQCGSLARAHSVAVTEDGTKVVVASYTGIASFLRDAVTGELTLADSGPEGFLGGNKDIAVAGGAVFVLAGTLRVYSIDATTGTLELVDEALSEDGRYLEGSLGLGDGQIYVSEGRYVSSYARSTGPAGVAFVDRTPIVTFGNGGLVVSSDGLHAYVSSNGPDDTALEIFARGFSGCGDVPRSGCRQADRGRLQLRFDSAKPKKNKFVWSWIKGEATTAAEFDDGSHFAMCVWDESSSAPELALRALLPAGGECYTGDRTKDFKSVPCWKGSEKVVKYKDKFQTPEGVKTAGFKPSTQRASIKLQGSGVDVGWALDPPLPVGLPLRVQLQSSSGLCWESLFLVATQNDASGLKAVKR